MRKGHFYLSLDFDDFFDKKSCFPSQMLIYELKVYYLHAELNLLIYCTKKNLKNKNEKISFLTSLVPLKNLMK